MTEAARRSKMCDEIYFDIYKLIHLSITYLLQKTLKLPERIHLFLCSDEQ